LPIDKEASRIWRDKIRGVLNRDWDPIGRCPADEYDNYVGKVAAMIRDNATDGELLKYFEWAEAVHMGFNRFDPARAQKAIGAIRALGPAPGN
jgi:hypothetical protein